MSTDTWELERQVEGMKAKLMEFKRFRREYQCMKETAYMHAQLWKDIDKRNRKMIRALKEIANAGESFRRKDILDFAKKVLLGLGEELCQK